MAWDSATIGLEHSAIGSCGGRACAAVVARIMVVEDEQIVARSLQRQLTRLGYHVSTTVSSGEDAIRAAQSLRPDLVLMDISLSGDLDGVEVAQHIRTHLDIPVVYLAASVDRETLERAKVTEPLGYVPKPFTERELHATIEMALYKQQAERRLQESERWLAATLKSIGDAVIATDDRGCIQFMNPVAQSLTGWREDEVLGKHLGTALRLIDSQTRDLIEDPVERVRSLGGIVQLGPNAVLLDRNGTEIPIDDSAAPIVDPRGAVSGVVLVFRDATQQKEAQEALRERTVGLEARVEELDTFSHTVAHNLKDPLGTMISSARMLQEHYDTMSGPERAKCLEIISRVGEKVCNIVDELLLLASVPNLDARAEPLHMGSIVTKAEQRLAYIKEHYQAEIVLPEDWPITLGHGPWVEEVWVNYLSNGIKYGGEPPRLELGATVQADGMVRLWVRDNGKGLSPENQARLFAPFTRLDQVRTSGYGLGLSIVRRIVEKLGGEVGVESEVGKGSTFFFTLPSA